MLRLLGVIEPARVRKGIIHGNYLDDSWDIHVFGPGAQGDVAPEAMFPDLYGRGIAVAPPQ